MNRNQAKDMLPIIQALAEGKHIQLKDKTGNWMDIDFINVELCNPNVYRIKPEPKYRPFKDDEECWNDMKKHQPSGWVKDRNGIKFMIENVDPSGFVEVYDEGTCTFNKLFQNRTFVDGLPFGVKVEG